MKIVFIHGRSQENKVQAELQDVWLQAAIRGVAAAGLPSLAELTTEGVVLPYYGDLIFKLTEDAGQEQFKTLVDRGANASAPPAEEQEFTQNMVFEMAKAKGISLDQIAKETGDGVVERDIQNWKAVLAALRLLDRLPHIGQSSIELFTRDVWYYLTKKGLRLQIDAVVDAAIPTDEPCVVVSHSLGTIVAYNLVMNRAQRGNIKALLTIGSPLGIDSVSSRVPSDTPPRKAPEGVGRWFNARDPQDTVALYELSTDVYRGTPALTNYSGVHNTSDNRHGIVQYLEDPTIAKAIYDAVKAP